MTSRAFPALAVMPSVDFTASVNVAGTVLTIHQVSTGFDVRG